MKNRFSYILVSLCMLGFLLAPVSPVLQIQNAQLVVKIEVNNAEAEDGEIDKETTLFKETESCGFTNPIGCVVQIVYFFFVDIPSWFLVVAAKFFNMMAAMTLSDNMYTSSFILDIWQIIRDFSNIFFILILLYAAFQIILGLGSGGGKKIVAWVMLIALLVNFSLFFSKVVIDSSNVLALIFYNKIDCKQPTKAPCNATGEDLPTSNTSVGEKNLAGALVSKFKINNFLTGDFIKSLKANPGNIDDWGEKLSTGITLSLSLTYGIVIYSLAWSLFMVSFSFLGRMIELMLLMMVSPLAFVTAAVPKFKGIDTIGFDSWLKKLISTSFVASIFMAILYIITLIIDADVFTTNARDESALGFGSRLILLFVPALLIVILLKKGSKYAQEASGEFTGMITGAMKAVGGVALGGAAGAVALGGTKVIGGISSKIAGSEWLKNKQEKKGMGGWAASMALKAGNYGSKKTFDVRKTALGGALGKGMGMDFQSAGMLGLESKKGGFKGATERRAEKMAEEASNTKTKLTDDQVTAGDYVDKDGKKITTAADLNNHRMQAYVDKIGKSSLISSVAYSAAKTYDIAQSKMPGGDKTATQKAEDKYEKEHMEKREGGRKASNEKAEKEFIDKNKKEGKKATPEEWKAFDTKTREDYNEQFDKDHNRKGFVAKERDTILDPLANKIKIGIGISAGLIGGVTAGGLIGGALTGTAAGGATGGMIGAGAGVGAVAQEGWIEEPEANRLAKADLEKGLKGTKGLEDRLKELDDTLKNHQETLEKGRKKFPDIFGTDGKINKDALAEKIVGHGIGTDIFAEKMKLLTKAIIEKGGDKSPDAVKEVAELEALRKDEYTPHLLEAQKLEELKGIEEKIKATEEKKFTIKGGAPAKPAAPTAAPAPAAPAAGTHI